MSAILERVLDAILRIDKNHDIKYTSTSGLRWLGGMAPSIPKNFLELIVEEDIPEFKAAVKGLPEQFECELRLKKQGKIAWVRLNGYLMPVVHQYMVCVFDISIWKNSEIALLHASEHDNLTGLANRALLYKTIDESLKLGILSFHVALIDLDGFKKVNDTFGHAAGDMVLIETAKRLSKVVGNNDLVARLGGDEFAIIFNDYAGLDEVSQVAVRILTALSRPFETEPHEAYISASVGLAAYPEHGTDYPELMKSADSAMYRAKNSGKNRFSIYAEEVASADFKIKSAVHKGIQDGEFYMLYQPQYSAAGKLLGAEALMRWESSIFGSVSPDKFIPIAEETGLMLFLGTWALRYACHHLKQIHETDPNFIMSVNVSPSQFGDKEFDTLVVDVLEETGVPAATVVLEITESTLMNNTELLGQSLELLHKRGVQLSIDDFGTGFSSLSYLTSLPVSVVKIDKSFVRAIEGDNVKPMDKKLILAMVQLAHSIDLWCVAEGVETQAQFDFLKECGCNYMQGYLLGKPMTSTDLIELVKAAQ